MTDKYFNHEGKLEWRPETKMEGKGSGVYARKYTDDDLKVINIFRDSIGLCFFTTTEATQLEQCGFDIHATAQALREKNGDTYIEKVTFNKVHDCMNRNTCIIKGECPDICVGYKSDKYTKPKVKYVGGLEGSEPMIDCISLDICKPCYGKACGNYKSNKKEEVHVPLPLNPNVQQAEDPEVRVLQKCKDYTDTVAKKLQEGLDESQKGLCHAIQVLADHVAKHTHKDKEDPIDASQWYCPTCDHLIQPQEAKFIGQLADMEPMRYCYQCGEHIEYHSKVQYQDATTKERNEKIDKLIDSSYALRKPRLKIYSICLLLVLLTGGFMGYGFFLNDGVIIASCIMAVIIEVITAACIIANVGYYCSKCHSTLADTEDSYCPRCHAAFLN